MATEEATEGVAGSRWPLRRVLRWASVLILPGAPAVLLLIFLVGLESPYVLKMALGAGWMAACYAMPLLVLDWYRGYRGTTGWRSLLHRCLRGPTFFLGILSTAIGIAVVVMMIHQLATEPLRKFHWGAPVWALAMFTLGVHWTRLALRRRAPGEALEPSSVIICNADLDPAAGSRPLVDGLLAALVQRGYRVVGDGAMTNGDEDEDEEGEGEEEEEEDYELRDQRRSVSGRVTEDRGGRRIEESPGDRAWYGMVVPEGRTEHLQFMAYAQALPGAAWCILHAQDRGLFRRRDAALWLRFGDDLAAALPGVCGARDVRRLTPEEYTALRFRPR